MSERGLRKRVTRMLGALALLPTLACASAPADYAVRGRWPGDVALAPGRDWKTRLLWGVLGLGSVLVAGFALSLLRAPRRPAA